MESYSLTDQQVDFYRANGYVQLPGMLTPPELAEVREAFEDANSVTVDPQHYTSGRNPEYERIFVQKVNLWTVHEGMRRFAMTPRLAETARQLCGADRVRIWHDHALTKKPGDSKPSAWHQDLPYWPMKEPGALSCWMALDDVDEANGCMQFVPRSHSWGRFDPIDLVHAQSLFDLVPDRQTKDFTPAVMRMPAGSCTFHHGLTFHYAGANQTDRPRRAMVVIYMPDGTTYTGKPHIVTDGLGLAVGEPIAGDLFPVVAGI